MNALMLMLGLLAAPAGATGVDRTTPNYGFIAIGSGTVNWAAKMNGNWDLADIQFSSVAVSTNALNAQLIQVAASTTSLSASTAGFTTQFTAVGVSTAALRVDMTAVGVATAALSGRLDQVAVSTTALSASTVSIRNDLQAHMVETSTHGATDQATAGRMVLRDASAGAAFGPITATSGTLTATGGTQYSLQTSSGIRMDGGVFRWPDGTISTTAAGGGGGAAAAGWTDDGTVVRLTVPTDSVVIQSTLTVQGQDAAGYSLALSSSITTGGCIKFGNGTIQCAASTGGGGGSSYYQRVATGTTEGPFSQQVQRSTIAFDSRYFTATDQAGDATLVSLTAAGGGAIGSSATTSVSLSGMSGTAWAGCNVSGSTLTMTVSNGSRIFASFAGKVYNGTSGASFSLSMLADGQFLPGYDSSRTGATMDVNVAGTNYNQNGAFSVQTSTLPAGSHSVCLGGFVNSGSGGITNVNQWHLVEVPAVAGGTGGSFVSSTTYRSFGESSGSPTSFVYCIPGSTIAVTTGGGTRIEIGFSAGVRCGGSGAMSVYANTTINGAFIRDYTANNYQGVTEQGCNAVAGPSVVNLTFHTFTDILPAGTYYGCAALAVSAYNYNLGPPDSRRSIFWMRETR